MITANQVADYLGITYDEEDERLALVTRASITWVEKRRSVTDPVLLWLDADVELGAVQYAALLYQTKSAPQGLPEYEDFASAAYGSAMVGIYRLVGNDPVIA